MAGRPSKLTERQWSEIGRRLALSESVSSLSREFKVARSAITARYSDRLENIKSVANRIVETDCAIEALPISDRVSAITLADRVKSMNNSAANAGQSGLNGASRLMSMFERKSMELPEDHDTEDLRPLAALAEVAQKGASIGLALMNANKDANKGGDGRDLEPFIIRRPKVG